MATIQTNGSATTGNYWSGSSTKNNNGTAKNVGSLSTVLDNSSLGRVNVGVFGSTVIDGTDTNKAITGGPIPYNNVKPIVSKVTSVLAGVNSNALQTPANNPAQLRSINKRESYVSEGYSTAFRAGYFNLYTGRWSVAPTPVTENPGTDNAASVTRAAPGTLRYRLGKGSVRANYSSKNT